MIFYWQGIIPTICLKFCASVKQIRQLTIPLILQKVAQSQILRISEVNSN